MQVAKNNPAFESPWEKLHHYFSRGDLFFSKDTHLCFVCGAAGDTLPGTNEPSLRALFIQYVADRGDHKIVCVRAETAATELLRQIDERGANISLFEKTIAETVDSILIFPESPGSFAELGFFSAHEQIAKKTLVGIKSEHQVNSFITLGPIHSIARVSTFAPVPFAIAKPFEDQMPQIGNRLLGENSRKRPYRQRLEKKAWKEYDSRQQLALLDEIIDLVGALTEVDIQHAVNRIFGPYDISKLRLQLSLLVATDRIVRNDDGDIFAKKRSTPFVEPGTQATLDNIELKASWRHAYEHNDPSVIIELDGVQT